jgi:hypothetical protein
MATQSASVPWHRIASAHPIGMARFYDQANKSVMLRYARLVGLLSRMATGKVVRISPT